MTVSQSSDSLKRGIKNFMLSFLYVNQGLRKKNLSTVVEKQYKI